MKIFAIADLHFDSKKEKPMNIFGDNWINHEEKIMDNWKKTVGNNDLVLIPGDISWASKLDDAMDELRRIDELPGIKIVGKGNHDYWWATSNKLDNLGLKTTKFLKNNSFIFDEVIICGTRGWDTMEEHSDSVSNERIYMREMNRLKLSLESTKKSNNIIVVMLHYPPFNSDGLPNEFFKILKEYNADVCIYGHLHGEEGHKIVREGNIDSITVHCVSSDFMDFKLKRIF